MSELLRKGPKRQSLDGFEDVYRDIVDYIIRCTHRIWEEKNIGLCRTHYSDDCIMHTMTGPSVGAEVVTQNTIGSLSAYSDRAVYGEDVIWSEDAPGVFYSSHRITSRGTHMGDEALVGHATMRATGVTTIADCKVVANRIVEEWLVRDNTTALWQVGADPWSIAADQAAADAEGDQDRHAWRRRAMIRTAENDDVEVPPDHPAAPLVRMLRLALIENLYGEAAGVLSPSAEMRWPSGRHGFGRGFWIGCVLQICQALHDRRFRCEHVAARPLPGGDVAVALRWSLTGSHKGDGVWREATGRDVYLLAVSHYRLRAGAVVEDVTVFDEVSVLRQVQGGLGQ
ncbi:MAG: ester cyclase [Litorimonas sp.]